MYCYCLFCLQQNAETIIRQLSHDPSLEVLSPRLIQRKWVKGVPTEESHPYLPGYLFLYSEKPVESFASFRREGVIRVLGDQENRFLLAGNDLQFAERLHDCGGVLGIQKVYEAGDRIRLCEGVLTGFAGEITKVNRQRRRMEVTFMFDGVARKVWMGYDIVTKPADGENASANDKGF